MNRRTRTLIVVTVAGVLALLASAGVYRAVLRASARPATAGRHALVVAAAPLPIGRVVTAADVRVVEWPVDIPIAGSFASVDQVVGRGVIASFVANEPIVADKMASVGSGAGLPPAIPSGMRAMAVKVNEVIGVAGFIVPGTHVDVVATVTADKEETARVVLSNVRVLAAGTNQEQSKANEPIKTTVVTLLVTPSDAERLALAMNEGRIVLALRNPLDGAETTTTGVRMSALSITPLAPVTAPAVVRRVTPREPRAAEPTPPPPPYVVQVIRAAKRTDEIIK